MQKVLNVWISEGRDIDDEKFWEAVDYNKQFDFPVEYYERWFSRKSIYAEFPNIYVDILENQQFGQLGP